MLVRRLAWAGLEIQTSDTTLVVDLLGDTPELSKWAGDPTEELIAPTAAAGSVTAGLVTHLHSDHFDVATLHRVLALGAPLLCPAPAADTVATAGFDARGVEEWETVGVGDLQVTAVPAVDGFGSPQVSWVVSHATGRLIHCGDTLWHGSWWQIAKRCGLIDLAFVPINAAITAFEYLTPPSSGLPAVLTPEQAAAAAQLLGARAAAPIHYGTFHKPPTYIAYPDAEAAFTVACQRRGVTTRVLRAGDALELTDDEIEVAAS
jgi:L-ascorbate metabolism protein UlaG (beta-lactamase superfamily)